MAQQKLSLQEFLKGAFTPQIAVLSTPNAEKVCQKNNLSFVELLQPFAKLNTDVCYKDPNGTPVVIRNLKVTFLDVHSRPPETMLARKLLNSSVNDSVEPRTKEVAVGEQTLVVPSSTPWFDSWRETFLRVQYPSDHEYTKHYLACLLVASSAENNLLDTMAQLSHTLTQMTPEKLPKWFSSNILKFYVIIHDNSESDAKNFNELHETIKGLYGGANCFLLRLNSRAPGANTSDHLPDPWSQFIASNKLVSKEAVTPKSSPVLQRISLEVAQEANEIKLENYHPLSPDLEDLVAGTNVNDEGLSQLSVSMSSYLPVYKVHGSCLLTDDIEQIKLLVLEFVKNCLLPYIENQMISLNDVVSNKKGVSKSLLSATKRWFSTNKPGVNAVAIENVTYAPDAPELQIRRLADLYFMFGNYSSAFNSYHSAKRDYNSDQAWLYYAGALEMTSLCAFMAGVSNARTRNYMEESINVYLQTCNRPQFATRATILGSECLKNKQMFGDAANQLIRMTSEEADLRSALLLEQAAYCFLQTKMIRKYAFHMVLAGNRYSKAAQRRHCLRCYKQAYQVYESTGWDLACDHIHYTIGRQANYLQQFAEAVESFAQLLQGGSKQSGQQQAIFLKEYLVILGSKLSNEASTELPILPVPELNQQLIKVLVGPTRPLTTPGKVPALGINFHSNTDSSTEQKWLKMEEMLVSEAGTLPLIFKPIVTLYNSTHLAKQNVIAILNEPIQVSLELANTLHTVLNLANIHLIWTFKNESLTITNESEVLNPQIEQYIKTHLLKSIIVNENSKQEIILSLTPLVTGLITITGVAYTLTGSSSNDLIFIRGKKAICLGGKTGKNRELVIEVVPSAPCLQVTFSEIVLDFLADELQPVLIDFQNTGSVPLKNIMMCTSIPDLLTNCEERPNSGDVLAGENPVLRERLGRQNHITLVPLPNGALEPGRTCTMNVWVKAPPCKKAASIDLLIYYENVDSKSIPRYRLVRHTWSLRIQESMAVEVSTQGSLNTRTVEELSIAIKATNLNQTHISSSSQIRLLNVGLLSRYWTLTKDIVTPKFVNLNAQESAHILLKARRSVQTSSQYSNIPLSEANNIPKNLKAAHLSFAQKTENPGINLLEEYHESKPPPSKDGILLLQWQALVTEVNSKRVVQGQCQLPITITDKNQINLMLADAININEISLSGTQSKDSDKLQKQVIYNLVHPPTVKHNFLSQRTCIVPITLLLHSIVEDTSLAVTINTSARHLPNNNPSSKFAWLGNGKMYRKLSPLSSESVPMSVVLLGPGTYDLSAHLDISCRKLSQDEIKTGRVDGRLNQQDIPVFQSCQIQSSLIVVNGNS